MMGKNLKKSKILGQIGRKISENPTFWIKFSKKKTKILYYGALKKIKIKPKIPPTCQNHPTMMANNLRFSKKKSKSNYNGGQKSAKFVILSQKSP